MWNARVWYVYRDSWNKTAQMCMLQILQAAKKITSKASQNCPKPKSRTSTLSPCSSQLSWARCPAALWATAEQRQLQVAEQEATAVLPAALAQLSRAETPAVAARGESWGLLQPSRIRQSQDAAYSGWSIVKITRFWRMKKRKEKKSWICYFLK